MSAYVIANVRVLDSEVYKEYVKQSPISIAAHGGRFLARGGRTEVLDGAFPGNRFVILEFPSYEQARAWWDSAAYRSAKALRESVSEGNFVLIDGVPNQST